jgi:hypothetical protein
LRVFQFVVAKAADKMVVHEAGRLHEGVEIERVDGLKEARTDVDGRHRSTG